MNPDSIRTVTHMEVNVSDQFMRQTRIEQFCAWGVIVVLVALLVLTVVEKMGRKF